MIYGLWAWGERSVAGGSFSGVGTWGACLKGGGGFGFHIASCDEVVRIPLLPPFLGSLGWGLLQDVDGSVCILLCYAPQDPHTMHAT